MGRPFLLLAAFKAIVVTGACYAAPATDIPPDYAFHRQLALPAGDGSSGEGQYRAKVPLEVLRNAKHSDLRDLRIFNGNGEKVPFAITYERAISSEVTTRVRLPLYPLTESDWRSAEDPKYGPSVTILADGTLVPKRVTREAQTRAVRGYFVDQSQLPTPTREITIDWTRTAETQTGTVKVETSKDLKSWRTLVQSADLMDIVYLNERLVQNRVTIPAGSDRYLRLSWDRVAFEVNGVEAEQRRVESVDSPVEKSIVIARPGRAEGEYEFDIGANIEVKKLNMRLPQPNTLAPTTLFVRASETRTKSVTKQKEHLLQRRHRQELVTETAQVWRPAGMTTFYRIQRNDAEVRSTEFTPSYTGQSRVWLAKVDPRTGGVGNTPPEMEFHWKAPHVVFIARGPGPFTLAAGRDAAAAVAFSPAELMPGYRVGDEFRLSPAVLVADDPTKTAAGSGAGSLPGPRPSLLARPTAPPNPPANATATRPWILWLVLGAGLLLMGWMAVSLSRGKTPPSTD